MRVARRDDQSDKSARMENIALRGMLVKDSYEMYATVINQSRNQEATEENVRKVFDELKKG